MSDFLFAQPSFTKGAGRVIDLWGDIDSYNASGTPQEADSWATHEDWSAVGNDLREAAEKFEQDHAE